MDVEAEIRDLKRRVGELEGSYSFLSGQLRDVHRSVLGFQAQTDARFDRVDERFDGVEARFDGVDARFDGVEARLDRVESDLSVVKDDVRRLREDLPGIVGGAVREALRQP
jgi:septation ring formation regulator EzrA